MGFLARPFPCWLFLDPEFRGKIPKDSSGVDGIRYSAMRVSGGFMSARVVVSRIWAILWKDTCNMRYAACNAG